MKQVTERNTKQEILEAYNQAVAEVAKQKAAKFNPEEEKKEVATKAVINRAETVTDFTFGSDEPVSKVKGDMINVIEDLFLQVSSIHNAYQDVKEAIGARELQLKELYNIEKEANTLAALINAQADAKEKHTEEMNAKILQKSLELDELVKSIMTKKAEFAAEQKAAEAELKEIRRKEQADYDYAFERNKKMKKDELDDFIALTRKSFFTDLAEEKAKVEEVKKELTQREEIISSKEQDWDTLENRITGFEKEKDAAVCLAIEDTTSRLARTFDYEKEILEEKHNGQVERLNDKIDTLTDLLEEYKETIDRLTEKLDASYTKIESIASKSVEGASEGKVVAALRDALKDKNNTNNK
jgi:colicin import membrane protein